VGSNSEIQGYNFYPILHFCRKFSSGVTVFTIDFLSLKCIFSRLAKYGSVMSGQGP